VRVRVGGTRCGGEDDLVCEAYRTAARAYTLMLTLLQSIYNDKSPFFNMFKAYFLRVRVQDLITNVL